jgi:hypothetical protein
MVFAVKSKTGRVNLSTQWRDLHIPTTNSQFAPTRASFAGIE